MNLEHKYSTYEWAFLQRVSRSEVSGQGHIAKCTFPAEGYTNATKRPAVRCHLSVRAGEGEFEYPLVYGNS